MQTVGMSTVLLGQGVPFMQAGVDMLRSKSLDRDSYNSGDWFNRLDFTYQSNNFGVGLPMVGPNGSNWDVMRPFLADPTLKAGKADITLTSEMFRELLEIRYSSRLFRLETAEDIQSRLVYLNTGPGQLPGLVVMTLSDDVAGMSDLDNQYERMVVLINANDEEQTFTAAELAGKKLALHPVLRTSVDRVVRMSRFTRNSGVFTIPARTAAVFVEYERPATRIRQLVNSVKMLVTHGELSKGQGLSLTVKLQAALIAVEKDKPKVAVNLLYAFIDHLNSLIRYHQLSSEAGQPLIEKARDIIWQITNDM